MPGIRAIASAALALGSARISSPDWTTMRLSAERLASAGSRVSLSRGDSLITTPARTAAALRSTRSRHRHKRSEPTVTEKVSDAKPRRRRLTTYDPVGDGLDA